MKLEIYCDEFINIILTDDSGAFVEYGKMDKNNVFGMFDNKESEFDHADFIEAIRLLGFNLTSVENEVIDYFRDNDLYIKASRKGTDNIKYSFLDTLTDREVCSSYDFMVLILKEVLNKENNASL